MRIKQGKYQDNNFILINIIYYLIINHKKLF